MTSNKCSELRNYNRPLYFLSIETYRRELRDDGSGGSCGYLNEKMRLSEKALERFFGGEQWREGCDRTSAPRIRGWEIFPRSTKRGETEEWTETVEATFRGARGVIGWSEESGVYGQHFEKMKWTVRRFFHGCASVETAFKSPGRLVEALQKLL